MRLFLGYNVVPSRALALFAGVFFFLKRIQSADDIRAVCHIIMHARRAEATDRVLVLGVVVPQAEGLLEASVQCTDQIVVIQDTNELQQIILIDRADLFKQNHRRFLQAKALADKDMRRQIFLLNRGSQCSDNGCGAVLVKAVILKYQDGPSAALDRACVFAKVVEIDFKAFYLSVFCVHVFSSPFVISEGLSGPFTYSEIWRGKIQPCSKSFFRVFNAHVVDFEIA